MADFDDKKEAWKLLAEQDYLSKMARTIESSLPALKEQIQASMQANNELYRQLQEHQNG